MSSRKRSRKRRRRTWRNWEAEDEEGREDIEGRMRHRKRLRGWGVVYVARRSHRPQNGRRRRLRTPGLTLFRRVVGSKAFMLFQKGESELKPFTLTGRRGVLSTYFSTKLRRNRGRRRSHEVLTLCISQCLQSLLPMYHRLLLRGSSVGFFSSSCSSFRDPNSCHLLLISAPFHQPPPVLFSFFYFRNRSIHRLRISFTRFSIIFPLLALWFVLWLRNEDWVVFNAGNVAVLSGIYNRRHNHVSELDSWLSVRHWCLALLREVQTVTHRNSRKACYRVLQKWPQ